MKTKMNEDQDVWNQVWMIAKIDEDLIKKKVEIRMAAKILKAF